MIPFSDLHVQVITGTTSSSAGTRTTHAHGLRYAPSVNRIILLAKAADDDSNNAAALALVKVDASYLYVKSAGASQTFTAYIFKSENEDQQFPTAD